MSRKHHCPHGLDLRTNPRCYLCRPVVEAPETSGLRDAAKALVKAAPLNWNQRPAESFIVALADLRAALAATKEASEW